MRSHFCKTLCAAMLAGAGVLSFGCLSPLANAAVLNLSEEPYRYVTVDQTLPAVLRAFGANLGISIKVSREVTGQVRGRLPELSERGFLEFLSRTYGLVWYYDGFTLYVESALESESKVFKLSTISPDRLVKSLKDLNIWDNRFAIKTSPGSDLTYVSGPKRYVELVEETIQKMRNERRYALSRGRGLGGGSQGGDGFADTSGVQIIYGTQ